MITIRLWCLLLAYIFLLIFNILIFKFKGNSQKKMNLDSSEGKSENLANMGVHIH